MLYVINNDFDTYCTSLSPGHLDMFFSVIVPNGSLMNTGSSTEYLKAQLIYPSSATTEQFHLHELVTYFRMPHFSPATRYPDETFA